MNLFVGWTSLSRPTLSVLFPHFLSLSQLLSVCRPWHLPRGPLAFCAFSILVSFKSMIFSPSAPPSFFCIATATATAINRAPSHSLTHHSPPGRSRSEQCAVSPLRPFPISAQSLIRIIHVLFARSSFFACLLPTIASSSPFLPSVSLSCRFFFHFEPNSSMTQSHENVLNLTIDMNRIDYNFRSIKVLCFG